MPDEKREDLGNWINVILGTLVAGAIVAALVSWNQGNMTAARVIELERHLTEAGEDRFTGRMGAVHDERLRALEVAVAKMECKK